MGFLHGEWKFKDANRKQRTSDLEVTGSDRRFDLTESLSVEVCDYPAAKFDAAGRRVGSGEALWLAWDGRLDNREDLAGELGTGVATEDISLVAAAYAAWGTTALSRLRGDWAISICDARNRCLVLAKDSIGTRSLFYEVSQDGIAWSNSLNALLRSRSLESELNLEYLAGWLTFFPLPELTPYASLQAVPPSSVVEVRDGRYAVRKYWEFTSSPELLLHDDSAYEERFRSAFTIAVRRRLRSDKPLLAELSGGVDSSSIVCVADALLKHERGLTPCLDTFSYYDDEEPNWDERPYFELIERQRGRKSFQARVNSGQDLAALFEGPREFSSTPVELLRHSRYREEFRNHVHSGNYGGVLSGIGGDEFTGGVPTPIPELSDLIATGKLKTLAQQLKTWALIQRRPWMHLLFDTLRAFAPPILSGPGPALRPPAWLQPRFRQRYRFALTGYEEPLTFWGPRPTFQENLAAVDSLRRQLAASAGGAEGSPEKRYPFLDRDLLEFLFSVPRSQLVQPGRRRALLRRALAGLVPDQILNRKRKAYVTRAPRIAIVAQWERLQSLTREMISESLGIVSSGRFRAALEDVRAGKEIPILPVHRTLLLECWLRHIFAQRTPSPMKVPETKTPRRSIAAIV